MNYIANDYIERAVGSALHLIKSWNEDEVLRFNGDVVRYIKERRTIRVSLPRQCGKTRYLKSLFYQTKSVLLQLPYAREHFRPELQQYAPKDISSFINFIRGRNLEKIDFLLIDEPDAQLELVDEWIEVIRMADLMSKDFIVIKLGTDRK